MSSDRKSQTVGPDCGTLPVGELGPSQRIPEGWKVMEPPDTLPKNWRVLQTSKGRIVHESPPPRIKIQTRNQLLHHQKSGKFMEIDVKKLSFLTKHTNERKKGFINLPEDLNCSESADQEQTYHHNQSVNLPDEVLGNPSIVLEPKEMELPMLVDDILEVLGATAASPSAVDLECGSEGQIAGVQPEINKMLENSSSANKQSKIEKDLEKIQSSVQRLVLDPNVVLDHKKELLNAAKLLNSARNSSTEEEFDLDKFKTDILRAENMDSCLQVFWQCPEARSFLQQMEQAVCLEELIHIGRSYVNGPFQTFPPNVNQNLYAEIIKFGLKHSRKTVLFLVNIVSKKDASISPNDVIKISFLLSSLANSVNRDNNSVLKVKSTVFQNSRLTNEGLDSAQTLGVTESSRSQRRVRDFLGGISPEVLLTSAKDFPSVSAMDNLDITNAHILHHMTLEFIEIEQIDTKHLDKTSLEFSQIVELFDLENILLTKDKNKPLLKHLKKTVAITIGRILAVRLPSASFLLPLLDNHYSHPNSKPASLMVAENTDLILNM